MLVSSLGLTLLLSALGCSSTRLPTIPAPELREERQLQLERTLTFARDETARLWNLLWPLLEENTALCRGQRASSIGIGFVIPGQGSGASNRLRNEVREKIYDFDSHTVIYAVADGSPAAKAGVQPGDRVLRLAGWNWSREDARKFNTEFSRRLKSSSRSGPFNLTVQREDQTLQMQVDPVEVCDVSIALEPSLDVQARTNGRSILVTRGMVERLDDTDIRTVLAHELAHCVMKHIRKATVHAGYGFIADLAFLSQKIWLGGAFSRMSRAAGSMGLEREADYVSLYLLANAGFDTANVARIWRELADEVTFTGSMFNTHPYSPERYVLLTKTHEEIEIKKSQGRPLIPTGMRGSR